MKNIFDENDIESFIVRLHKLKPLSMPLWGKMNSSQMLAHCNVVYEMIFENIHKKPNAFIRFMLKSFVKDTVVGTRPYQKNANTAKEYIIKTEKDFDFELKRLLQYIIKTKDLGPQYFDGRESLAFGKLTATEWNNMLSKHLDHHLNQFGV